MNPPTSPTHSLRHRRVPCPNKAKKTQKSLFKGTIPTPHMLPNFTLVPSHTSYCKSLEKFNQPLLINLQRLTPYALVTFFMHQPPQSFPYFASITLLHNAFVSNPYLHNHLPNKAELKLLNHLIPSPPTCIGLQTLAYFTMCNLESPLIPLQRKSLCNFSMRLATFPSTGSMERKYVGKEEIILLIRVTLPHFHKPNLIHIFLKYNNKHACNISIQIIRTACPQLQSMS